MLRRRGKKEKLCDFAPLRLCVEIVQHLFDPYKVR